MPRARQSSITAFLPSPGSSRPRARPDTATAPIQLNFVNRASYTVVTETNPAPKPTRASASSSSKKLPKLQKKENATAPVNRKKRKAVAMPTPVVNEWDDSDSDQRKNSGSEEGTPERLGAVRLETGKSQLEWGERGPGSDDGSSSSESSEDGEEERQKKRVIVEDSDEDEQPVRKSPSVEIINLESDSDPKPKAMRTRSTLPRSPAPVIPSSTPPRKSSAHDPLGMFSDFDDPPTKSSQPSIGYTRAAKRRARTPTPSSSSQEESESEPDRPASPPPYRTRPPIIKKKQPARRPAKPLGKRRKGVVDPDEEEDEEADSEDEVDPGELVKELEMDEPSRKEAKMRGERYTSPVDLSEEDEDDLIVVGAPFGWTKARHHRAAPAQKPRFDEDEESEGAWTVEEEEELDGFIDDEGKNEQEDISTLLPEKYQMGRYQNLEYHFKVISQFLIHLVIRGPSYALERQKPYYRQSYDAISRKLKGQKDSLVTSSVWKTDFKRSLETYPEFVVGHLDEVEYGCDACHLTGRLSKFVGDLRGNAYDRDTFEDLDDVEEDEDNSDDESDEGSQKESSAPSRGPFKLERNLYDSYKESYKRLSRRLRSGGEHTVNGLTKKKLRDPDEVVQWLDSQGHIMSQFERLSGFEFNLARLT
ncbi:hypothetical protein QFC21_005485 [Naganishia friedmannii]|uniref:Uncharacterized protein n=1 Tax=Naganishia friedmannii TaxID=89922 RepID=A0ACC2V8X7_9TREE|nr:hypothetical protein QFC21_005485 [Naganishia friedmannii]